MILKKIDIRKDIFDNIEFLIKFFIVTFMIYRSSDSHYTNLNNFFKMFNSVLRLQFIIEVGGNKINFLDTTIVIHNERLIFD